MEQTEFEFDIPPYQKHSNTSQEAAEQIMPKAGTLRAMILEYLQARGVQGATDHEIQQALGLEGSTQRPRRVELYRMGLIKESGQRETKSGRKATVWRSMQ